MTQWFCLFCLSAVFAACNDDSNPAQDSRADTGPGLSDIGLSDGENDAECRPTSELCDAQDNDCDGLVDEGFSLGETCTREVGQCESRGVWACGDSQQAATCNAPDPEIIDEVCDGEDNDCDGATDETFDLTSNAEHCGACGQLCSPANAMGNCQNGECNVGRCLPGFVNINLEAADGCECEVRNEGIETCNGIDDDCDGVVDESFHVGNTCQVGIGGCARDGLVACNDEEASECVGEIGSPVNEVCNGIDDDCDGTLDEGFDQDDDGALFCPDFNCDAPCPEGADCAFVCQNLDCNDDDASVSPRATELCGDNADQNCDGNDAPCIVQTGEIFEFSIVPAGQEGCRDLNGDGDADNAFGILAGIINPSLEQEIAQGGINLFALAYGLETTDLVGRFELAIVYASRGRVADASLNEAGRPINFFPGTRMERGELSAGPRPFTLELPLAGGVNLQLQAQQATLTGQAQVPAMHAGQSGIQVDNGLLTAGLPHAELRRAIVATAPDFVGLVDSFEPDLDLDNDGIPESLGLCAQFRVRPATLDGIPAPLQCTDHDDCQGANRCVLGQCIAEEDVPGRP